MSPRAVWALKGWRMRCFTHQECEVRFCDGGPPQMRPRSCRENEPISSDEPQGYTLDEMPWIFSTLFSVFPGTPHTQVWGWNKQVWCADKSGHISQKGAARKLRNKVTPLLALTPISQWLQNACSSFCTLLPLENTVRSLMKRYVTQGDCFWFCFRIRVAWNKESNKLLLVSPASVSFSWLHLLILLKPSLTFRRWKNGKPNIGTRERERMGFLEASPRIIAGFCLFLLLLHQ